MIHNMNSRQPWRKWARFIIYAIALFILVRLIKAILPDSLFGKPSKLDQVPKKRGYKQQTILNYIPENDTLYYRDFPWYKAEHTRPQFSPNHTLLTQHLDSRQRQLVHDKAVTQAKQLALRKFPAHEYKGIRGSHWRDDDAASKDFRKKVDCWTTGEWVKDENSLQLNHVQDPLYSSCDNKFYKTHDKDQKREAAQYSWKSKCPLKFNTISAPSWCKVMMGRHMLLVGDLVHYQFHDLLLDSFRDDPTVCFGELNCKDHTICKSPKDTRIRYIRNDILSTIRSFKNRDQGHPLANVVEWPFVTSSLLTTYPILVLSRTPLLGEDDAMFTRRLVQTMKVIRDTSPDALVIYKSYAIGHPFCDDADKPLDKPLTDSELQRLPFGWSEIKRRNAIARAVVEAAGGLFVDLGAMVDMRPDGHVGGSDCLRYCIPGPLDATMQVLYHVFLGLEKKLK